MANISENSDTGNSFWGMIFAIAAFVVWGLSFYISGWSEGEMGTFMGWLAIAFAVIAFLFGLAAFRNGERSLMKWFSLIPGILIGGVLLLIGVLGSIAPV